MILKGKAVDFAESLATLNTNVRPRELTETEQIEILHIYEAMQRSLEFHAVMSSCALAYDLAVVQGPQIKKLFISELAAFLLKGAQG